MPRKERERTRMSSSKPTPPSPPPWSRRSFWTKFFFGSVGSGIRLFYGTFMYSMYIVIYIYACPVSTSSWSASFQLSTSEHDIVCPYICIDIPRIIILLYICSFFVLGCPPPPAYLAPMLLGFDILLCSQCSFSLTEFVLVVGLSPSASLPSRRTFSFVVPVKKGAFLIQFSYCLSIILFFFLSGRCL